MKVEGEGEVAGVGTFDKGESVTLTATAAEGWRFVGWSGVSTENPWTFAADTDVSLVAIFERIPVYSVNGEAVREGTVKSFTAPESVVLSGTTQLVCRGTSAYPEKGASFEMAITGDVAFEWDLWSTNYWVDVTQTAGGTVTARDGAWALPGWVEAGVTVELTATPVDAYSLMRWVIAGLPCRSVEDVDASHFTSTSPLSTLLHGQENSVFSTSSTLLHGSISNVSGPLTVSAIFAVFNDTLATAADAPAFMFRTGGDAEWTPVIDPTAETGYTSVKSGAIGAESETWLETTVSGTGTLSFNWRVNCECDDSGAAEWDRLMVFTNGVEAARIDGQTGWQRVELPLSAPKTTVRWSFYRDDHDEVGAVYENAAWIDGVGVR